MVFCRLALRSHDPATLNFSARPSSQREQVVSEKILGVALSTVCEVPVALMIPPSRLVQIVHRIGD